MLESGGIRRQNPRRRWPVTGDDRPVACSIAESTEGGDVGQPLYSVDGLACRDFVSTIAEFNRVFEQWWGAGYWHGNLDTFNDIIDWTNDMQPYTLVWSHAAAARRTLGHDAMADWLAGQVSRCEPGYGDEWRAQLAQARAGSGPTLFDWFVEIIAGHEQIELRLE